MNTHKFYGLLLTAVLAGVGTAASRAAEPADPVVTAPTGSQVSGGEFQRIYLPPMRDGKAWYINDHCFIRDDAGRWHMFGITQSEPRKPQQEDFFAHAVSDDLLAPQWTPQPDVLHVDAAAGETVTWAPHIVHHEGIYYMFYCAGGPSSERYRIHLATSRDLYQWERHPGNPLLVDGFDARDPMVLRVDDQWVLYYTANSTPAGGNHLVVTMTSKDLVHWGDRRVAFTHPRSGTSGGPTESPFVVMRHGLCYLFVCTNRPYNSTAVYVSADPFSWKPQDMVGSIPAHAAEVVASPDGRWFISRAGWDQGGLYLAPLNWPKRDRASSK